MSTETLKLWKYKRTSTPKKEIAFDELAKQEEGINRLLERHPEFEIYKTTEEALSGTKTGKDRPKRQNIIDNINECDGVIVDTLSRWSRSVSDAVLTIEDLAKKGKLFVSSEIIYDPKEINSQIQLRIYSMFADLDRIMTVEKLQLGREIYKKNGGHLGRNFKQIPDKIVKQIIDLYVNKKLGIINIAKIVSPFEIVNEHNQKEEISISKNIVLRILKENNVKIRGKKDE